VGRAIAASIVAIASHLRPGSSASHDEPDGSATHPTPRR
jgi:hypothetical protein